MHFIWRKKKPRKYPVKKDEYGRSARKRAFEVFNVGKRPAETAHQVGISCRTACRYFADWKKLPKNFWLRYDLAKTILKRDSKLSEEVTTLLADYLGMSQEEVMDRLQKPWGLKQLLVGEWPNYRQQQACGKQKVRLRVALELVRFVESRGISSEELKSV